MEFVHDRNEMVTDGRIGRIITYDVFPVSHIHVYSNLCIYIRITLVKTSADLGAPDSPVRDDTFSVLHRLLEIDTLRTEHRS